MKKLLEYSEWLKQEVLLNVKQGKIMPVYAKTHSSVLIVELK